MDQIQDLVIDKSEIVLNTIEEAIADIKAGKVIIVVDDEDRENEGDFVCAAECVTPDIINFMATYGRGLICTPITPERAEELELSQMVKRNTDLHGTAFTISVDYKKKGCTTGISAYDRATGIQAMLESDTLADDFARPGHIFPLVGIKGGVLRRTGHTEAALDLATLAGLKPGGVLVEILNEDGTMARLPQLVVIAQKHELKIISIKDLVAYRMRNERLIEKKIAVSLETAYGSFDVAAFAERGNDLVHLAISKGSWNQDDEVLVRVHSSTNSGDIIGGMIKGVHREFSKTLERIAQEGTGVFLYLRHKEDKDELFQTLKKIKAQQENNQTLDPFPSLDNSTTQRNFGIGAQILNELGIRKLRVLTNSPRKHIALEGYGLEVIENVPI